MPRSILMVGISVIVMPCLAACTAARQTQVETSIQRLAELQRQRQAELDATTDELNRLRLEVKAATSDVVRSRCEARVARIDADIKVRQARCVRQIAEYTACAASNEARTAKSGAWGCALGWAAGALSGGSLMPFVLVGCGGGIIVGGGGDEECGEPPICIESLEQIEEQVLRAEGLEKLPSCEESFDPLP